MKSNWSDVEKIRNMAVVINRDKTKNAEFNKIRRQIKWGKRK